MRAGVEPCKAASECLHLQFAILQELLVDGGYLQLATGRGLHVLRHAHHLVGVEIEADDGIVRLGLLGLLLYREAVALAVELRHAVALGVVDPVAEDGCLLVLLGIDDGLAQQG